MQVATVPRRSLFDWSDLHENLKKRPDAVPPSVLTAITEFDRAPRLIKLSHSAEGTAAGQW